MTGEAIKTAIEHISGALTIVYPEGLPVWDSSRLEIEDNEELEGTAVRNQDSNCKASKDYYKVNETALWWAGKELLKEKTLGDYVGKNDKTKVVVKIQKVIRSIFKL